MIWKKQKKPGRYTIGLEPQLPRPTAPRKHHRLFRETETLRALEIDPTTKMIVFT